MPRVSSAIYTSVLAAITVTVTTACDPKLRIDPAVVVACDANGICPAGSVCVNGARCVAPERIDSSGVVLLAPDDADVRLYRDGVVFAWQAVAAAQQYTLTAARDPLLTQLVDGMPQRTGETSLEITLPPGTYYWGVTSDITTAAAPAGRIEHERNQQRVDERHRRGRGRPR